MAAQPAELQNKNESDSEVSQNVPYFLDCIAWGRQNEAEAMLKGNKEFALASGDVTDHAKRTFKNITGLQYAVWALDWKMWSMLLPYLPLDALVEQATGFTQGSWVNEHGVHANWKNLIHALEIFIEQRQFRVGSWSWEQLAKHLEVEVNDAQCKLPMHVLQEYNNPNRPFEPCPDFSSTEYTLERSLPDWLFKFLKESKSDFCILRARRSVAKAERVLSIGELIQVAFSDGHDWPSVMERGRGGALTVDNIQIDIIALVRLYETRIQQRDKLITALLNEKSKAEVEAQRFAKTYLDNYLTSRKECTLHLLSEAPQPLVFEQTPALVFVSEKNGFELIVNTDAGLQKIKAPKGIDLKTLAEFFKQNKDKKKVSLSSEDPIIQWIKRSGGHNSNIRDVNNNTALHDVAMKGQVALIEPLALYEDYCAQNKMGLTPLLLAAQCGKLEVVMALLSSAPESAIAQSAIAQNDLLSILVINNRELILNKIWQQKRLYEDLLVRVGQLHLKNNDAEPNRELMKNAAIGQMYKTALDVKSIKMLTLLIQIHPEGLNILYIGQTPLHYAVQAEFTEAVHLLVDKGSDLSLKNGKQLTALALAENQKSDLKLYLTNEVRKAEQQKNEIARIKSEIELNRSKFVNEFLESFVAQELPKQKTFLQKNNDNLKRLKEALDLAIKGAEYDNWFVSEEYHKLATLMQILNEMLIKKIKENALTESRRIGCDLFQIKELSAAIQEVIDFDWQSIMDEQEENEEQNDKIVFKMLSQTQVNFCEHFEKQFDEAYSYFRALDSKKVVAKKELETQQKMEQLKKLSLPNIPVPTPMGNISIPTTSVVSGALTLMQYFREYYSKKEARRMVDLFRAVTPYERTHFIRYTAEQIADKYNKQIHHLAPGSEGVEVFAQCVAARVVEYITSDDSHQKEDGPSKFGELIRKLKSWVLKQEIPPELQQQKSLYNIFLDGIIRVTSIFPTDKYRLQTINSLTMEDNWCSKGIFENTGIITPAGERYALRQVDVDRYGYCYGTTKEAEKRGLNIGPKEGVLWSAGRIWVKPKETQGLDPLPANKVQQSKPIIFSINKPGVKIANKPKAKKESKLVS